MLLKRYLLALFWLVCVTSGLRAQELRPSKVPAEIYVSAVDGGKARHHFILRYSTQEELNELLKVVPAGAKVRVIVPEGTEISELAHLRDEESNLKMDVLVIPSPTAEDEQGVEDAIHKIKLAEEHSGKGQKLGMLYGIQKFMAGIRDWAIKPHDVSARLSNRIVDIITKLKVGTGVSLWMWKAAGSPEITSAAVISLVTALASFDTYMNLANNAGNVTLSAPVVAGSAAITSGFFLDWWFQRNATWYVENVKQGHAIGPFLGRFNQALGEFFRKTYDKSLAAKGFTVDVLVSTFVGGYFRWLASITDGKQINPFTNAEFLAQHFGSNIFPWLISAAGESATTSLIKKRMIPRITGTMLFQFWALSFFTRESLKNAGLVSLDKGNLYILTLVVGAELTTKGLVALIDSYSPGLLPRDQKIVDFYEADLGQKGDIALTFLEGGASENLKVVRLNSLDTAIPVSKPQELKKMLSDCGVVFANEK